MIVISDASPIINLAIINCLEFLPKIFGKIIVPQSVFDEITLHGAGMPGANEVQKADWIEIRKCSDESLFKALRLQIDPGEAEAIVLALELPADFF